MKYLVDTHAFLWFIAGDSNLPDHARWLIETPDIECLFSVAAIWEIVIKSSQGKLKVPMPTSALVCEHVWSNKMEILEAEIEHFDVLHTLPHHHRDPFDRMMIAQAIHNDLTVITKDKAFSQYDVKIEWSRPV